MLQEEKTLSQIAAAYGVHPSQVTQWRDEALSGLAGLFSHQSDEAWRAKAAAYEQAREQLYAEIGRLSTQLTWLKKKLVSSLSRAQRLAMVERAGSEVSMVVQCALLGLNRSLVYYHPKPVVC